MEQNPTISRIPFIGRFLRKRMAKDAFIMAFGTLLAQLITIAAMPVVTRIFSPEAFGVFGAVLAIVAILAPVAALAYPVAIVLPEDDSEAVQIGWVSAVAAVITSLVTLVVVVLFQDAIAASVGLPSAGALLWMLPAFVLASGILQIGQQFRIRQKLFRLTAIVTVSHAFLLNAAKVIAGLFHPTGIALVAVALGGIVVNFLMLGLGLKANAAGTARLLPNIPAMARLAKHHRDFPLFMSPERLVTAATRSLPVIILAMYVGPAAAGFFALANSVLRLPARLVSKSIGDVIYPKLAEDNRQGRGTASMQVKASGAIGAIVALPFALVLLFGPDLFGIVFGEEWMQAGHYARWLALLSFCLVVSTPSMIAVPVLNLQAFYLRFSLISSFVSLAALLFGLAVLRDDIAGVALYSSVRAVSYVCFSLIAIRKGAEGSNTGHDA